MTTRRQFLQAIMAAGCAPAIVRASSLMPISTIKDPVILFPDFRLGCPRMILFETNPIGENWIKDKLWAEKQIRESFYLVPSKWDVEVSGDLYSRVKICLA